MVLAAFGVMNAARVSEKQARDIAGQFFKVTMPDQPASMKKLAKGGQATAFYVFNNPEQPGWVIIAGDDRARPILAYGDEDYFVAEDVPECVQDWLNGYAEQIAAIDQVQPESPVSFDASVIGSTKNKIAPLLSTIKWAQGLPFNQQCPSFVNDEGNTSYSPSGCVAIAMAQLMYYYKSNYGCDAIPAYTSSKNGFVNERPALSKTTFNWAIMNPWYDNAASSSSSAKEVQKLVKYCGQAVRMDYGKTTSSATSQRNAFTYYFGYDKRYDKNSSDYVGDEAAEGKLPYNFYRVTQKSVNISKHHCYFQIENAPAGAKFIMMDTTGEIGEQISSIDGVPVERFFNNGRIYNLNGQMVGNDLESLPRGIYIVNGKKVIK